MKSRVDEQSFEALASAVWELDPLAAGETLSRERAALYYDRLLGPIARSRGALDLAIGQGFAALLVGDRLLRLGYSCLSDYTRECLGMAGRTAYEAAYLARSLQTRPLLRKAVLDGTVTPSRALTILPVAHGANETRWVERACRLTVRALRTLVRKETPLGELVADDFDEPWQWIGIRTNETRDKKLQEAFRLARKVLGYLAPRWRCLEAISQEFLGAHPIEWADPPQPGTDSDKELLETALEAQTDGWHFLQAIETVACPRTGFDTDPLRLDRQLRQLVAARNRWDELVGRLAFVFKALALWRELHFASFEHYITERIGLSPRTIQQRAWLERRFHELPGLREALQNRRLTYAKALLVARISTAATVDHHIRAAETTTCIQFRRKAEAAWQAHMSAQGWHVVRVPARIRPLLEAAITSASRQASHKLDRGEAFERVLDHFLSAYAHLHADPRRRRHVLERNNGMCEVPGCSRTATHLHHVVPRSRGGGDSPENLVGLCPSHHLHGVHLGYIGVTGTAPDKLQWDMPAPPLRNVDRQ